MECAIKNSKEKIINKWGKLIIRLRSSIWHQSWTVQIFYSKLNKETIFFRFQNWSWKKSRGAVLKICRSNFKHHIQSKYLKSSNLWYIWIKSLNNQRTLERFIDQRNFDENCENASSIWKKFQNTRKRYFELTVAEEKKILRNFGSKVVTLRFGYMSILRWLDVLISKFSQKWILICWSLIWKQYV